MRVSEPLQKSEIKELQTTKKIVIYKCKPKCQYMAEELNKLKEEMNED